MASTEESRTDDPRGGERRRGERALAESYAAIRVNGLAATDQAFGLVLDASTFGVRVRTPQPPEVGRLVTLRVAVADEIHEVRAHVTRVHRVHGATWDVGLEYDRRSLRQSSLLEELLGRPA